MTQHHGQGGRGFWGEVGINTALEEVRALCPQSLAGAGRVRPRPLCRVSVGTLGEALGTGHLTNLRDAGPSRPRRTRRPLPKPRRSAAPSSGRLQLRGHQGPRQTPRPNGASEKTSNTRNEQRNAALGHTRARTHTCGFYCLLFHSFYLCG